MYAQAGLLATWAEAPGVARTFTVAVWTIAAAPLGTVTVRAGNWSG